MKTILLSTCFILLLINIASTQVPQLPYSYFSGNYSGLIRISNGGGVYNIYGTTYWHNDGSHAKGHTHTFVVADKIVGSSTYIYNDNTLSKTYEIKDDTKECRVTISTKQEGCGGYLWEISSYLSQTVMEGTSQCVANEDGVMGYYTVTVFTSLDKDQVHAVYTDYTAMNTTVSVELKFENMSLEPLSDDVFELPSDACSSGGFHAKKSCADSPCSWWPYGCTKDCRPVKP
eukprot:TRINITY_DN388_c0_g2_i1.p1 TRINITY_DN388_c0_g2~~TRINITY_DN388_c0_g2_i1.p1  ORF type:complete len:231 (-),score=29.90 TRINITY_DN388_c0_g2_i1:272-964(-)